MLASVLLAVTMAMTAPTYTLRIGPTFGGVYYPPYGGQDPYGAGGRLDLAVQTGTGRFRFHGLLTDRLLEPVRDDSLRGHPSRGG